MRESVGRPEDRRACENGQAVIETAIVLPILLAMVCLFVSVMLQVQAQQELDTAVALATEATFQVPAGTHLTGNGSGTDLPQWETFEGTMSFYPKFFGNLTFHCSGNYLLPVTPPNLTGSVTCHASATLLLSNTPVAWVQFGNPQLTAAASAKVPPIRQ